MDYHRAKQIVQSKDNIDVYLHGNPIWINQVNSDRVTAMVRELDSGNETIAYLKDLQEGMQ